jgi:hypothetical protein
MFRGALASDFCTLFWNILFSVLSLPLTIPAFLASLVFGEDVWNRNLLDKSFRGLLTYFGLFIGICLGLAAFEEFFGDIWHTWGFWPVIGAALIGIISIIILMIGFILGVAGVCAVFYYGDRWIRRQFQEKKTIEFTDEDGSKYNDTYYEDKPIGIVVLWNTIRNKYCTKITWK